MMESNGRQTIKVKPQLYHFLAEMGIVIMLQNIVGRIK